MATVTRRPKGRTALFWNSGTAAVLVLVSPGIACAQSATPAPQTTTPASATADASIGDIVVTAQKRQERLQDVPISATVMGGRELDQSTAQGASQALTLVPGVSFSKSTYSGGGLISVRGVSAPQALFGGASPIAYYLDSVPFGLVQSATAPDSDVYDLDRIEVLRGPQGTLYGASALNGVVRILTKDPDFGKFDLKFRLSDSDTEHGGNNFQGNLAVNLPLIDGKLALRTVVGYRDDSGWLDTPNQKDENSSKERNYRFKLGAQPTDDLTIVASAWLSRTSANGVSAGSTPDFRNVLIPEPRSADFDAYSLRATYDFHSFSATSSTSYLHYTEYSISDPAYRFGGLHVPLAFGFNDKIFTQELTLASEAKGPWRWTAGAFYRHGTDVGLVDAPAIAHLDWTNTSTSFAAYGELTRLFAGDKLEFTLGGRYFHDDVVTVEDHDRPPVNGSSYYRAEGKYNSATPRVVLSWHPQHNLSAYASFSQGFRSGSPQAYYTVNGHPGFPDAKPDKLNNYEVGLKGDLRNFSFDAAVYYMKWNDIQQQITVQAGNPPVATSAIINGTSASGVGVDFAATIRPFRGLDLSGSISWNNLRSDADIFSSGVLLFAKGERLNNSPKYNAGASANYTSDLGGDYTGRLSLSYNYTDKKCARTILKGAEQMACGVAVWTTRAAYSIESSKGWRVTAFVDNLNNFKGVVIGNPVYGPDYQERIRPRTFGLSFDYHL